MTVAPVAREGSAAGLAPLDIAAVGSLGAAGRKAALARFRRIATLPFDHDRRAVSVLVEDDAVRRMIITKGAPEGMLERCADVPAATRSVLEAEFSRQPEP